MRRRLLWQAPLLALALVCIPARKAAASDRYCDPSFQDCRAPLLTLIANEKVGIDVAFWFMEDPRYSAALIKRFQAGVPVRVLVDPRANAKNPLNADRLKELADAGIPMRKCISSGILHWKVMIFSGQNTVEFGGANYSQWAFVPAQPYVNYTDEVILFTDDLPVVQTFMTKYDELWINNTIFADYANIHAPLVREYPKFTLDPALTFPPADSYVSRATSLYKAETGRIDALMYRITDQRHADAMIAARQRGLIVRVLTEPDEYRNPNYLWDAWNVDRMYMAGVEVKMRAHQGLNHGKLVLLYNQAMSIFGSSNWTSASTSSQQEHNYFLKDASVFEYFRQQFVRKWNNKTGNVETKWFTPLPPEAPAFAGPSDSVRQPTSGVKLAWKPGYWAHYADVYFGTTPDPPLVARDVAVTPKSTAYYALPTLTPGKTYYWRIVSKTAAKKTKSGSVWRFVT
ncbi:MAG TPA: phospholipase D-like domain-containing protein [Vicinamibacterales bacterium]